MQLGITGFPLPFGVPWTPHRDICIASMSKPMKRTSRACERCRFARRRCEPPYPCRQCVESGVSCDVRAKARPQRHQQRKHQHKLLTSPTTDSQAYSQSHSTDRAGSPGSESSEPNRSPFLRQKAQDDPYELIKGLVQDLFRQRHGT